MGTVVIVASSILSASCVERTGGKGDKALIPTIGILFNGDLMNAHIPLSICSNLCRESLIISCDVMKLIILAMIL